MKNLWAFRRACVVRLGLRGEQLAEFDELLACRLGVDRAALPLSAARFSVKQVVRLAFEAWSLKRGKPLAFITGEQPFLGERFAVGRATLIPRPETEELVAEVLRLEGAAAKKVLDLGTGSGNIAVSLAAARPKWQVEAVDVSNAALAVARRNAKALLGDGSDGSSNIKFRRANYCSPDGWTGDPVDVVVANPPYIGRRERAAVQKSVLKYEPKKALLAGETGLEHYEAIASRLRIRLRKGGRLYLELGATQADAVRSIFLRAGLREATVKNDLNGKARFLLARI